MKSLNYDGEIECRNFGTIRPISLKWTEKFLHIVVTIYFVHLISNTASDRVSSSSPPIPIPAGDRDGDPRPHGSPEYWSYPEKSDIYSEAHQIFNDNLDFYR